MKTKYISAIVSFLFCLVSLQAQLQTQTLDAPFTTTPSEVVARDWILLEDGFSHDYQDGEVEFYTDKTLVCEADHSGYTPPTDLSSVTVPKTGAYRGLSGNVGVSPMGAATYSVPIEVLPGHAGIQPNLSLVYNSMSGIGQCGMGWNLAGLSVISRTTPTIYHDGVLKELQMNSYDQYILDGQRLIKYYTGFDGSGNLKITFYPENYNGTIIEAFTSSSVNPGIIDRFEATLINGTKYYYEQLFETSSNKVLSWHLTKIEDLNGNQMVLTYGQKTPQYSGDPAGIVHPVVIEYNKNGTGDAMTKVEFIYESGIQSTKYIAGELYETGRILKQIDVSENDKIFRKYHIDYEEVDSRYERIVRIRVENPDMEETNPIYFQYGEIGQLSKVHHEFDENLHPLGKNSLLFDSDNMQRISLDYNGDGLKDMLLIDLTAESFLLKTVIWSADIFLFKGLNINGEYELGYVTQVANDYTFSWVDNTKNVINTAFMPVDIDGDGNEELVLQEYYENANILDLKIIDPYSSSSTLIKSIEFDKVPVVQFGNINGDEKIDIIVFDKDASSGSYYWHNVHYLENQGDEGFADPIEYSLCTFDNQNAANKFIVTDLNGDSKSDIMLISKNGFRGFLNQSTLPGIQESQYFSTTHLTYGSQIRSNYDFSTDRCLGQGDFNGDGFVDFLVNTDNSDWSLCINNGEGFFTATSVNIPASNYPNELDGADSDDAVDKCYVADFNGDGKSDVIVVDGKLTWDNKEFVNDGTKIYLYITDEYGSLELLQSYDYQSLTKILKLYSYYVNLGDYNFDGLPDMLWYTGNESGNNYAYTDEYYMFTVDGVLSSNRLEKIKDGLDNTTNIVYDQLIEYEALISYPTAKVDDFYKIYTLPEIEDIGALAGPLPIVKEIITEYSDLPPISITYEYEEAIYHKLGKGFLGFKSIVTNNSKNDLVTIQSINWDGTTYTPEEITSQDFIVLNEVDYYPLSTQVFSYTQTPKFEKSYISKLSSQTKTDHLTNVITTTTNTYSDINLIEQILSPGTGYTTTTEYSNFVLGNPTQVDVTKKVPDDGSSYTTQKILSIDASTGNLTQIIENSNKASDFQVKTEYSYNSAGNPTNIVISSGTLPIHTTSLSYTNGGRTLISKTTDSGSEQINYNDFRQPVNVTSPYGEETKISYDSWGRKLAITLPLGETLTSLINWSDGTVTEAKYYTETSSSFNSAGYLKVFYNSQGQEIYRKSTGFDNAVIVSSKEYNEDGSLYKESIPYYLSNGTKQLIKYDYDEYGRLIETDYPNGKTVSIEYDNTEITYETESNNFTLSSVHEYNLDGSLKSNKDPMNKTINFTYFSHGNLQSLIDPESNNITFGYDDQLNQTSLSDLDAGLLTYDYNAYGQITSETNANEKQVSMVYDDQGRLTSSTQEDLSNSVYYYTSGNGEDLIRQDITGNGIKYDYDYDENRRLTEVVTYIDASHEYTEDKSYDSNNRVSKATLNDKVELFYTYGTDGTLEKVILKDDNISLSETVWEISSFSPTTVEYQLGNGKTEIWSYDVNGLPTQVKVNNTFEYNFAWDAALGQLESRTQKIYNNSGVLTNTFEESFNYDILNRLTSRGELSDGDGADVSYKNNGIGLIDIKSDVGEYQYTDSNSPHRLSSVLNPTVDYAFRPEVEINYTSFDKVNTIEQGTKQMIFTYGPDQSRKKMEYYENTILVYTRYYADNYERTEFASGDVNENYYIGGANGIAAIYHIVNGTGSIYYVHTDYLGSVLSLTDENGNLVTNNQFSYDAWGRRRDINWEFAELSVEPITDRGFTGHEHIDEFNLINMNGRIYDPLTAQFLSPDNFVQSPTNSQNLNRYTYCLNNPLIYTDPSGEIIFSLLAAYFCPALLPSAILLDYSWMSSALNEVAQGGNVWEGIGKGLAIGLVNLGFSQINVNSAIGNGLLQSGIYTTTYGLSNLIDNRPFFDKWSIGYASIGLVSGGYSGYINAKNLGLNPWTGGMKLDDREVLKIVLEDADVKPSDPVKANDKLIVKLTENWYPGNEINMTDAYTVENVPKGFFTGEYKGADGATIPLYIKNKDGITIVSGRSNVYFNKDKAFSSYKKLYTTIGHELLHVSQISYLGSLGYIRKYTMGQPSFVDLMEYRAYEFRSMGARGNFDGNYILQLKRNFPDFFYKLGYLNFPWAQNAMSNPLYQ